MGRSESILRVLQNEEAGVRVIWMATKISVYTILIPVLTWCSSGAAASSAGLQKLQLVSAWAGGPGAVPYGGR